MEKSSVFSIGILILSSAVAEDYSKLYDFGSSEIKFPKILKRLNYLKMKGYPDSLTGFLAQLLEVKPENRPDLSLLKKRVEKLFLSKIRTGLSFLY